MWKSIILLSLLVISLYHIGHYDKKILGCPLLFRKKPHSRGSLTCRFDWFYCEYHCCPPPWYLTLGLLFLCFLCPSRESRFRAPLNPFLPTILSDYSRLLTSLRYQILILKQGTFCLIYPFPKNLLQICESGIGKWSGILVFSMVVSSQVLFHPDQHPCCALQPPMTPSISAG